MRLLHLPLLLAAACPFLLAACASTAVGPAREGAYALLPGDRLDIARNATLAYTHATDSRCPRNVTCIWRGELVYHFVVTTPTASEEFALRLAAHEYTSKLFSTSKLLSAVITLEDAVVPPPPKAGAAPPSYPVTLRVVRQ